MMNKLQKLFKSKMFILLFSMCLNIIIILLKVPLNLQDTYFEIIIAPALSLSLGPFAIIGSVIVEFVYLILSNPNHIESALLAAILIFAGNMALWKLWYFIPNRHGYDTPNLNHFYNVIKFDCILLLYTVILAVLFYGFISSKFLKMDLGDVVYYILPLGLLLTVFSQYIMNRYDLPQYSPRIQFRKSSKYIYLIVFVMTAIASSYALVKSQEILFISSLTLLITLMFLIVPFNDKVYEIKNNTKLNLFSEIILTVFILLILSTFLLELPMTLVIYDWNTTLMRIIELLSSSMVKLFMLFFAPFCVYLYYLEKNMLNPINRLSDSLSKEINTYKDHQELKANLSSINTQNELESLADSLLDMENDLRDYSDRLIEVTSQKERFETELRLAHDIQHAMIPRDFEQFNHNEKYEVWGLMRPAHEVAGDFYDFFRIDEDNIGFVIGDVSGKGITASLIMVKSMTLIQDYAKQYDNLSEVFYKVNNLLCEGNAENLFVTCWLGRLNVQTGELHFVNAGHNQPLLKQDGKFRYLTTSPELVLGIVEDMSYELHEIQLNIGDALFLYTDGVVEANNNYEEFYGENRLQNILNKYEDEDLSRIINKVETDVDSFCSSQEQFDDITMFAVKWQ